MSLIRTIVLASIAAIIGISSAAQTECLPILTVLSYSMQDFHGRVLAGDEAGQILSDITSFGAGVVLLQMVPSEFSGNALRGTIFDFFDALGYMYWVCSPNTEASECVFSRYPLYPLVQLDANGTLESQTYGGQLIRPGDSSFVGAEILWHGPSGLAPVRLVSTRLSIDGDLASLNFCLSRLKASNLVPVIVGVDLEYDPNDEELTYFSNAWTLLHAQGEGATSKAESSGSRRGSFILKKALKVSSIYSFNAFKSRRTGLAAEFDLSTCNISPMISLDPSDHPLNVNHQIQVACVQGSFIQAPYQILDLDPTSLEGSEQQGKSSPSSSSLVSPADSWS